MKLYVLSKSKKLNLLRKALDFRLYKNFEELNVDVCFKSNCLINNIKKQNVLFGISGRSGYIRYDWCPSPFNKKLIDIFVVFLNKLDGKEKSKFLCSVDIETKLSFKLEREREGSSRFKTIITSNTKGLLIRCTSRERFVGYYWKIFPSIQSDKLVSFYLQTKFGYA